MIPEKTIVVKLSKLYSSEGSEIDTLVLREPTARDMRSMDSEKEGKIGQSIALLAKVADVPVSTIDSLSFTDFTAANEAFAAFLEDGPEIGEK